MEQLNNLAQALEKWRQGQASTEEVIELSRELGNTQYRAGIPVLIQLLEHEDEIVRYNAAMALSFKLHYEPAASKLLAMLESDTDEDCRGAAAAGLGSLFQDKKDGSVLRALAHAALNDADGGVRSSAYEALLHVNGLTREEHLKIVTRPQPLPADQARVNAILATIGK